MDPSDALTKRAQARIGQVLRDKWRIDRLLGSGGMATVYAATHVNNGKRVAVKILHPELSVNQEVRTRFLREGYVANKVAHPGIVQVLDDDTADDGSVFLVMELLEGESVGDLLERSGHFLPVRQVVKIADQLLDVLAAAHQAGIVHRDIKPDNLFIGHEGTLKVLDFGIARLREISGAQLTLTGAGAMGTPAFMPPEQARGRSEQIGPRTDLWAVGATMYTMASGRLVHEAETVNELLLAAMTKPAAPFLSVLPNFPPALAAVIDRALAYDQAARWADAHRMQAALRQAAASLGIVLGDWSSISGINPIVSLAALAAGGAQANPLPPANTPRPASPSYPMPAPMPMQAPPMAAPPMQAPAPMPAPMAMQPPMYAQPAPRASVPEITSQWQPPPRQPSSPEIAPPMAAPAQTAPHHGHAVMATAPAVTVGAGRGASGPSRGVLIAAIGGLVVALGGAGLWAALRSKPAPTPADRPPPAVSAESTAHPAEPPPTVTPAPTVAPTTSAEAPPPATAKPASSSTAGASSPTKTPKGPAGAGPRKPSEQDILNRRR